MHLIKDRISYTNKMIEKHPTKKSEIYDLFQLMEDEISEGESPDSEFEKFVSDVKQLTET